MSISVLINSDEYQKFQKLFAPKTKCLSATVARLYHVDGNNWRHSDTGMISMTKDNERRNYYFQLYNMDMLKMTEEMKVAHDTEYIIHANQIHVIVTKKYTVLLNFADFDESVRFSQEVKTVITNRREQRERKRQSQMNPSVNGSVIQSNLTSINTEPKFTPKTDSKTTAKSKKDLKKICKADISGPSNFQHLDHMGLNYHFFKDPNDENLKKFLRDANLENLLDYDKSKKDIYDFVEKHGGLSRLGNEMKQKENRERKAPGIPKQNIPQNVPPILPPPTHPSRPPPSVHMAPSNVPDKSAPSNIDAPPAPVAPAVLSIHKPSQNKPAGVPDLEPRGDLLSEIVKIDPKKLKAREFNEINNLQYQINNLMNSIKVEMEYQEKTEQCLIDNDFLPSDKVEREFIEINNLQDQITNLMNSIKVEMKYQEKTEQCLIDNDFLPSDEVEIGLETIRMNLQNLENDFKILKSKNQASQSKLRNSESVKEDFTRL